MNQFYEKKVFQFFKLKIIFQKGQRAQRVKIYRLLSWFLGYSTDSNCASRGRGDGHYRWNPRSPPGPERRDSSARALRQKQGIVVQGSGRWPLRLEEPSAAASRIEDLRRIPYRYGYYDRTWLPPPGTIKQSRRMMVGAVRGNPVRGLGSEERRWIKNRSVIHQVSRFQELGSRGWFVKPIWSINFLIFCRLADRNDHDQTSFFFFFFLSVEYDQTR